MPAATKKVAVVGGGVSGIGASWLLSENPDRFQVTLYEKNAYVGGHTNTFDYRRPNSANKMSSSIPVDTGFIVFNKRTYPNFCQFLEYLKVAYEASDMSFAVSRDFGHLEWAGSSLKSVFAQVQNAISPRFWLMLLDIIRFNALAPQLLELPLDAKEHGWSIGQYLDHHNYSEAFQQDYLIPMTAAIWSTPGEVCWRDFPAETLIRFMSNHGLLSVLDQPQWYTITNGSRSYVSKALKNVKVLAGTPVKSIARRKDGKVVITDEHGVELAYDEVIVAAHGDQALRMLKDATPEERRVLGRVEYGENRAVVHADEALMPRLRDTWSSWNYMTVSTPASSHQGNKNSQVCLTYWMNKLQNISAREHGHILVTLNPLVEPKKDKVVAEVMYEHPLYSQSLILSQRELKTLNKVAVHSTHTYFCGAWTKYGFHEDGLTSGLYIAESLLGAKSPIKVWEIEDFVKQSEKEKEHVWWMKLAWVCIVFLFGVLDTVLRQVPRVSSAKRSKQ